VGDYEVERQMVEVTGHTIPVERAALTLRYRYKRLEENGSADKA